MSVVVSAILAVLVILLCMKIVLLGRAVEEIRREFSHRLSGDTNTLITVSTRNRHIRRLAADMNGQLRLLREERHRFQQGDRELKEAVTNISHDLRTPLTAIFGYLELLEREDKSQAVERYLTMIDNRCQVLRQLMEELFGYSVVSSTPQIRLERLSLNRVLEESLASCYDALTRRQIFPDISIPSQQIERELDRSALNRIFGNIISNVLKYSDGDLSVTLTQDGTIIFANTARKLTPVTAGRLFDRFYTVESARNSTGLGLSIARLLTGRMGGAIDADYQEGKLFIILKFPELPDSE